MDTFAITEKRLFESALVAARLALKLGFPVPTIIRQRLGSHRDRLPEELKAVAL
jgi:hypothetical protein